MNALTYIAMVVAPLMFIAGCQGMPSVTRSGNMKEVFIRDNVSPVELSVNAGDEVRWTNKRMDSVRLVFLQPLHEEISCRNNFGNFFQGRSEAELGPNESASLCFREPTYSKVYSPNEICLAGRRSQRGRRH